MTSNYRKIGDFIELVDERNKDLAIELLLGLSVTKEFIPSVANTVGTNMKNYKIIRKGQFACSVMQVRRDKKMPVALLQDFDEAIISQAYPVFQITDESQLLPEYLMMWFTRSEFDREACFHAVGGVRGSLEWEDFLNMKLPVPSIEKQREIVKEYNTVVNRIKLNEQLNQKLEETAQTLYKHWFVDFNFPITKESCPELVSGSPELEGKPYKSSGGEMVYNEELDMEIPVGWEVKTLNNFATFSKNRISVNDLSVENYISTDNMLQDKKGVTIANKLPTTKSVTKFLLGDILISNIRPYLKKIWQASFEGGASNDVLCIVVKNIIYSSFIYTTLEQDSFFDYVMQGAKGTKMPRGDKDWIMNYTIIKPNDKVLSSFSIINKNLLESKINKQNQEKFLVNLSRILLSKMTKIETEKEMA